MPALPCSRSVGIIPVSAIASLAFSSLYPPSVVHQRSQHRYCASPARLRYHPDLSLSSSMSIYTPASVLRTRCVSFSHSTSVRCLLVSYSASLSRRTSCVSKKSLFCVPTRRPRFRHCMFDVLRPRAQESPYVPNFIERIYSLA